MIELKARLIIELGLLASFLGMLIIGSGCAPVISDKVKTKAQDIPFAKIHENPDDYKGKVVVLSGVVLEAQNTQNGTQLVVLQTSADSRGRPKNIDNSEGRFLALYDEYLDVAIYRRGREVTIGGKIIGQRILSLGEINYTYPLVRVQDIHLWPVEEKDRPYYYSPPYYWHHPWWDYYWYPYGPRW